MLNLILRVGFFLSVVAIVCGAYAYTIMVIDASLVMQLAFVAAAMFMGSWVGVYLYKWAHGLEG